MNVFIVGFLHNDETFDLLEAFQTYELACKYSDDNPRSEGTYEIIQMPIVGAKPSKQISRLLQ